MTMTVYVVDYFDIDSGQLNIEGVFSSEEKANAYVRHMGIHYYSITEYVVDELLED